MALHSTQVVGGLVSQWDRAIRDQIIFADDGKAYHSLQAAVDNAESFVRLGPGTFTENILVTNSDITIRGSGRATLIDGTDDTNPNGTQEAIRIHQPGVTLRNLSVRTDPTAGGNCVNFSSSGGGSRRGICSQVWFREAGGAAIQFQDDDISLSSCIMEDIGSGFNGNTGAAVVESTGGSTDCRLFDLYIMNGAAGSRGFDIDGGDHIIASCEVDIPGSDGIFVAAGGVVVNGNRVIGAAGDGIHIDGEDCVVDSNVVTGTTGTPIETATPTTVTVGDNHAA